MAWSSGFGTQFAETRSSHHLRITRVAITWEPQRAAACAGSPAGHSGANVGVKHAHKDTNARKRNSSTKEVKQKEHAGKMSTQARKDTKTHNTHNKKEKHANTQIHKLYNTERDTHTHKQACVCVQRLLTLQTQSHVTASLLSGEDGTRDCGCLRPDQTIHTAFLWDMASGRVGHGLGPPCPPQKKNRVDVNCSHVGSWLLPILAEVVIRVTVTGFAATGSTQKRLILFLLPKQTDALYSMEPLFTVS